MRNAEHIALFAVALLVSSIVANAQAPTATSTPKPATGVSQTATGLVEAANQSKASSEELLRAQEAEIIAASAKLDELRQLVAEGLIARMELEASERSLAALKTNLETTRQRITDSSRLIADIRAAEDLARTQLSTSLKASTGVRKFVTPTILRYNGLSSWSLGNLNKVQSFFATNFGQALPTSAVGQSATHNRLGYDHRNAVDVAVHPDSVQGKALISYLQSQGIPFLAFRAAVPGVATGPHIHIGSPSHRLG